MDTRDVMTHFTRVAVALVLGDGSVPMNTYANEHPLCNKSRMVDSPSSPNKRRNVDVRLNGKSMVPVQTLRTTEPNRLGKGGASSYASWSDSSSAGSWAPSMAPVTYGAPKSVAVSVLCKATLNKPHQRRSHPCLATIREAAGR